MVLSVSLGLLLPGIPAAVSATIMATAALSYCLLWLLVLSLHNKMDRNKNAVIRGLLLNALQPLSQNIVKPNV